MDAQYIKTKLIAAAKNKALLYFMRLSPPLAEYAERWDEHQIMEVRAFQFEQLADQGATVNAEGAAAEATVYLDSGNVNLRGGVRIIIDSEDVILTTYELKWRDNENTLTAGEDDEVEIERSDGTHFTGTGFFANTRNREFIFTGQVRGRFVEDND